MKNTDTLLIHRTLNGDDNAFAELVKKYQKQVHALVWRKIGDFHTAEEITQDVFLKAYQRADGKTLVSAGADGTILLWDWDEILENAP